MMRTWPSILRRKHELNESSVLWDTAVIMTLGIPIFIVITIFDSTLVNDELRWIKPLKFFASIAIYSITIEWIYRVFQKEETLTVFNRFRWIIGAGGASEAILITLQAARGVQSHFNVGTPLDLAIFSAMGIIITIVVSTAFVSLYFIWKARKQAPRVYFEAIIYGGLIMTIASFQGFAMTSPTPEQLEAFESGSPVIIAGSHFVGDLPQTKHATLPFTGWSLEIGDLRISHFIGLHALQFLIVSAFLIHRFKIPIPNTAIRIVAASYCGLFVFSFLQAQSGQFLF